MDDLSKGVHSPRNYSNFSSDPNHNKVINSWAISGFIDGEGSFNLSIYKDSSLHTGWRVKLIFKIALHEREKGLLELIKDFLQVGNITKHGPQSIQFRVSSLNDLELLMNFLEKYPLITNKYADYVLFKKAFLLMSNKEHLTEQGLLKLVAIKASMNLGISPELKSAFPGIIPQDRPNVLEPNIYPDWMRGFSSAEGCFLVNLPKSQSSKLKMKVQLVFQLTQHSRDEKLMRSFIDFFDCGNVFKDGNNFVFRVTKFNDVESKIIPFFRNYLILGVKYEDFKDFCLVASLVQQKKHLTALGLDEICEIKARMNRGRK